MSDRRPAHGRMTARQLELLRRMREGGTKPSVAVAPSPGRPAGTGAPTGEPEAPVTPGLSAGERQLWFLARVAPAGAEYHVPLRIELPAGLGAVRVARALADLVSRHEALRTTFPEEPPGSGTPARRVAPPKGAAGVLGVVDLFSLGGKTADTELERLGRAEATRPFDLARGPLQRALLVLPPAARPVLFWTFTHAIVDGASLELLLGELVRSLDPAEDEARESLGTRAPRLSAWVAEQAHWLAGDEARTVRERRLRELRGGVGYLDLPFDRVPTADSSTAGGTVPVALSGGASAAFETLARDHGATPFMVGLSLYSAYLARLARLASPDVAAGFAVGVAMANRHGGEDRATVGLLANMVVVRATPADGPAPAFVDLLSRVRKASLDAFATQRYPFERLVEDLKEELGQSRQPGRNPVFQVSYSLRREEPWSGWRSGAGPRVTEMVTPAAKFDLSLDLWRGDERFEGRLWYRSDLFDRTTAGRIARGLAALAEAVAIRPLAPMASLAALPAAERHQVLTEWAEGREGWSGGRRSPRAGVEGDGALVPERIASWARSDPGRVALVVGQREVGYGELLARADGLAWRLWHAGVGPESRVGVCLERGTDLVAALLGVWRSGATYVPLDPAYPRERLAFMLEDSGARWVVTDQALAEGLDWPGVGAGVGLVVIDAPPGDAMGVGVERAGGGPPLTRDPEHLSHVIYTSGSTGRPKGVGIRHGGVLSLLRWAAEAYGDEDFSGVLAATSVCFDLSVFEIFVPLALGGRVIVAENALSLPALPARDEVRLVNTVPSALRALLRSGDGLPAGVRTINLAGEPLHLDLARSILEHPVGPRLFNLYGPSEDTTYSTGERVRTGGGDAPGIGRALPRTRALVLDDALTPVPMGSAGELCLTGDGLARGYLGRPALTAGSFVPDPSGITPGGRAYRTGDRVRWRRDGSLEFLGRRDGQVKVRGFRIELGEVEASLTEHPDVAEVAVVVARGSLAEDARLIAFVALRGEDPEPDAPGGAHRAEAIHSALRERLPNAMVPSRLIVLPELPHTPSGKIDRRALPRPTDATPEAARPAPTASPRDPAEELIAQVWAELLGVDSVAPDDDFFALGGHSLQVPAAAAKVSRLLGVDLDLGDGFRHPTVAGWARLAGAGDRAPSPVSPRPVARDGRVPLSFAQRRVWFLDRLEAGDPSYNLPLELALRGPLEPARLARVLGDLTRRHEALRTCLREAAGEPWQEVVAAPPEGSADALPVIDLSGLPPTAAEREGEARVRWLARRAFDLGAGPPVRRVLLRRSGDDHSFVQVVHHAVWDGGSTGIFLRELEAFYAGRPLPEPPLQLGDFAHWQRRTLTPEALEDELRHWESRLAGLEPLELPGDHPRPAVRTPRGGSVSAPLPVDLVERVRVAGRRHGASPFMVALAAFAALLHRYAGGPPARWDVGLGTPVSGRDRPELEGVVGFLAETLVLRVELDPAAPGATLLARARETVLDAFAHRSMPFDLLVDRLRPERDLARSPLFQAMLVVGEDPAPPTLIPPGADAEARIETAARPIATGTAKFDLGLALDLGADSASAGRASLEYSADLFDRVTARRMLGHGLALLSALAADPEAPLASLPLLTPVERHQAVVEWGGSPEAWRRGDPARVAGDPLVPERIAVRGRREPERVALLADGTEVTYGELLRRAGVLARRLREAGAGPEDRVGVCLERSPAMVEALLGVWLSGAAYVPLDPAYPRRRLAFMLEDARVRWVVTDRALAERPGWSEDTDGVALLAIDDPPLGADDPDLPPVARDPEHLALVIYTSGSTGQPKGVGIPHRGVDSLFRWAAGAFDDETLSGVLASTSMSFDLSIFELWVTLALGGRAILAENTLALPSLPARDQVRLVNSVPSTLGALLRTGDGLPDGVRVVTLAGETLHGDLARRILDHPGLERLVNLWGPSEDTTFSSGQRILRHEIERSAPGLGRPFPGTRTLILDDGLAPVPPGVHGEVYLAGAGLARGYLGRPARTAESFVPDPHATAPGGRLYRTGDRMCWRRDGTLEWVGRLDGQVKVRGFRIELGEVESVLIEHPEVSEAAAVVERGTAADEARLVAYVGVAGTPEDGSDAERAEAILATLRDRLPKAMVPSRLVVLPSLPHTPSGKIDRRALPKPSGEPAPQGGDAGDGSAAAVPRDPVEELVAGLWGDLLGLDAVGPDEDFFTLGGHSLLATRVAARVQRDLGVDLPLRAVFEQPTPARLAARIRAERHADRSGELVGFGAGPVAGERPAVLPPSFAQRRLWFLDRLTPGSSAYNVPVVLRLEGELDIHALGRAVAELARRHESLRTRFEVVEDEPRLAIDPPSPESPLRRVDLAALPPAAAAAEARRIAARESVRPFDLARGPLFRAVLVSRPGDGAPTHLLALVPHHTVADWWSLGILFRELDSLYRRERRGAREPAATLPILPIQFVDYALWERRALAGPALDAEVEHWRARLVGREWARLPTDRPGRPAGSEPHRRGDAGEVGLRLAAETGPAIRGLARSLGATPFMVLVAALQALLARLSGGLRVAVGTPIASRDRPGTENLVGFLGNTLVLRADLSDEPTFAELVARVRDDALEAYEHAEVPFELLVERIAPERVVGRTPFFQVLVSYQQQLAAPSLEGVEAYLEPVPAGAPKFDLTVTLGERSPEAGGGLLGYLVYDNALWARTTVERFSFRLVRFLERAVGDPERPVTEVELLSDAERAMLLREGDGGAEALREATFPETFLRVVRAAPDAVALACGGARWSYGGVARRAAALAERLRREVPHPEDRPVAVLMERSADAVVAMLGVMASGAAYLPLDPTDPPTRLRAVLDEAAPAAIVAGSGLGGPSAGLPESTPVIDPGPAGPAPAREPDRPAAPAPESAAYAIYTSGSSGRPKGVVVEHRQLAAYVAGIVRRAGLETGWSYATVSSLATDLGHTAIFPALATGGTLHVVERESLFDPVRLAETFRREPVDVLKIVPSHLAAMLAEAPGSDLLPERLLVLGGEAASPALLARVTGGPGPPAPRVINHYGPTETTVGVATWSLGDGATPWRSDGPAPIGRALPGDRLRVTDRALRPVPPGVPGELCVGGAGVARGYLHRPAATAERFVPDPFAPEPGARLYRTGDRCVVGDDGAVRFLGRIDDQVKIRGFRVEPGELESVLQDLAGVEDAAVVVHRDRAIGDAPAAVRLVAFVEGAQGVERDLRRRLRERLPEALVPSEIHRLGAIPRTAAGKRDRKALARLVTGGRVRRTPVGAGPPDDTARRLVALWRRLLPLETADEIGLDDNFFDLGGHSLLLIRLQGAIRRELGIEVAVVDLFAHPTVASQARLLAPGDEPGVAAAPLPEAGTPLHRPAAGIAVIGMAGRFPGARSVEELWRNLLDGVESLRAFSDEEEETSRLDPALLDLPGYVNARGVLDDVEWFDADFFGFRPREAALTDPQQRVFLECAWEALEDAGHRPEELGERAGLFAGAGANTYFQNHLFGNPAVGPQVYGLEARIGNDKDFLTTRVSYKLDLQGPSVAVQSSCSTSLVAVHLACRALLEGECDVALAGGVRIGVPQATGYLYEEGGVTSPDGHCRPFDARARGMVPGNGAGVVVLRRLEDALADGDPVRAVILGSAVNNDGSRKVGYAAPSVEGQERVIRAAHRAAGIEAGSIGLVEAHGTGTPLGDPIEVEALTRALGEAPAVGEPERDRPARFLGSIKSNIGHLDTAAGVAGLIKTVLALERRTVPPTAHFETPNPALGLERSGFRVLREAEPWPAPHAPDDPARRRPRRAGVSSFGIGGTNAHAVLEEAPAPAPGDSPRRPRELLVLSARSREALGHQARALAGRLRAGLTPPHVLADVAHTLQIGRRAFAHRLAVHAATPEAAAASLDRARPRGPGAREDARAVFLFPGQGAPLAGALRALVESEEAFREALEGHRRVLAPVLDVDLFDFLLPGPGDDESAAGRWRETRYAQPALVAVELALARLWEGWGVRPAAVAGHSVGELAAAAVAGVLDDETALLLAAERGRLMHELPPGGMLAVPLGEEAVTPHLGEPENGRDVAVALAGVNAPDRTVVAGSPEALDAFAARVADAHGVACRPLEVAHAFHSHATEAALAPFARAVARAVPELRGPEVPWISTATADWMRAEEAADPEHWSRQMRGTVRFAGAVERLAELEGSVLLEVGPGRALSGFARRTLRAGRGGDAGRRIPAVASLPGEGDAGPFEALAELWVAGVAPDWASLRAGERRLRVPLPTYPFERRRYWFEPVPRPHVGREAMPPPGEALAEQERPELEADFVAPRDEVETAIAQVWAGLFGIARIGAEDDFFDLGGDSLLATRIVAGVRDRLDVEVTPAQLFEERTVAGLAVRAREALERRPGVSAAPGAAIAGGEGGTGEVSLDDIEALLDEVEGLAVGAVTPPAGPARKGDG